MFLKNRRGPVLYWGDIMKSILRSATAVAVALCLPACATVTRGTKQKFVIETTPTGADVALSTGQKCTSPCNLKLKRKDAFTAKFSKEGYQPAEAHIESSMRGGGGAALAGNVLIGGIFGAVVDASSGSMNDLQPNPLRVTLVPISTATIAPEQAAPSTTLPDAGTPVPVPDGAGSPPAPSQAPDSPPAATAPVPSAAVSPAPGTEIASAQPQK